MKKGMIRFLCAILLLAAALTGLSACDKEPEDGRLLVAVTLVPQKAFVEAVCGDLVQVAVTVPPGYSPGSYEPSPAEVVKLAKADVYFAIELPLEESSVFPRLQGVPVVNLAARVREEYEDYNFPGTESRDHHIWLSIKRVIVMVEAIADKMEELDPHNAAVYRANADAYIAQLQALDVEAQTLLEDNQGDTFITFHPAYGYIAGDYGLTMLALEEEGKEAAPQHLQYAIDFAKAHGIRTVFSNAEADSPQADAFAEEIGGQKVLLAPLAEDYIDNYRSLIQKIDAAL